MRPGGGGRFLPLAVLFRAAWPKSEPFGLPAPESDIMHTRNADGKFATQNAFDRFTSKISPQPSGCWHWTGTMNAYGYGMFSVGKRNYAAHRYAFQLANGIDPAGFCVCHRCDNPPCVNPAHLFLGTTQDNIADKLSKGRQRGPAAGVEHFSKLRPEGVKRGSQLPQARLSENDVRRIRELYSNGQTQTSIAAEFGICASNVGKIVRGQGWGHVK